MSATQVQAAKILLDKTLSNAPQQTEISGPDGGPLSITAIEIAPVASVKATG